MPSAREFTRRRLAVVPSLRVARVAHGGRNTGGSLLVRREIRKRLRFRVADQERRRPVGPGAGSRTTTCARLEGVFHATRSSHLCAVPCDLPATSNRTRRRASSVSAEIA